MAKVTRLWQVGDTLETAADYESAPIGTRCVVDQRNERKFLQKASKNFWEMHGHKPNKSQVVWCPSPIAPPRIIIALYTQHHRAWAPGEEIEGREQFMSAPNGTCCSVKIDTGRFEGRFEVIRKRNAEQWEVINDDGTIWPYEYGEVFFLARTIVPDPTKASDFIKPDFLAYKQADS